MRTLRRQFAHHSSGSELREHCSAGLRRTCARCSLPAQRTVLPVNQIVTGNALDVLRAFPSDSVDMVITSPPYRALRSYGTSAQVWPREPHAAHEHLWSADHFCWVCDAWRGELGREPNPELFLTHLCDVFDEIRRVLKPRGSCWVNMGDTYAGTGDKGTNRDPKYARGRNGQTVALNRLAKPKSLCQIPSRFAIGMVNRGWILRNEIIWHKPNCMPSSVRDRFTVDFEKLFFFTKNNHYHFETQYEPLVPNSDVAYRQGLRQAKTYDAKQPYQENFPASFHSNCRNRRSVWSICTRPCKEAHFAVYPPSLIETPIRAGCPEGGIVLDPFMGSGTTALVALRLARRFVGIELHPAYVELAKRRIAVEKVSASEAPKPCR